ncbi:unnamed protein product [Heterosigma akashiwo]|mmetsp:Transcript_2114/g.3369  ORF Transcript_2114/g.3369 Transcript_2114/m.3369 type:complete len:369 (-) Transcript_2114:312-1418(-)
MAIMERRSAIRFLLVICVAGISCAFSFINSNVLAFSKNCNRNNRVKVHMMAQNQVAASSEMLDRLFSFKPLFNMMKGQARKKIQDRLLQLGTSWDAEVSELLRAQEALEEEYARALNPEAVTPDYYTVPFHGYDEGNLCWAAATEVEAAAISVHAPIFADPGELRADGDDTLRQNFHDRMMQVLDEAGFRPKTIADLGCSTGLSSMKLARTFPGAREITGVDLSPHMVAVARHRQQTRAAERAEAGRMHFLHGAAEATGLPDKSQDLVSLCLVNHELPAAATREILAEARRIVKPGGAIALMDMDPSSVPFQRLAANPFAFAGFKSTEPWLQEYAGLDLAREVAAAGFRAPAKLSNSPRHQTLVAFTD